MLATLETPENLQPSEIDGHIATRKLSMKSRASSAAEIGIPDRSIYLKIHNLHTLSDVVGAPSFGLIGAF